jgi:hypothetical protein
MELTSMTIVVVCVQRFVKYGLTQFWTSIIYPKEPLSKWHLRKCLMGGRDECDVETLPLCP